MTAREFLIGWLQLEDTDDAIKDCYYLLMESDIDAFITIMDAYADYKIRQETLDCQEY